MCQMFLFSLVRNVRKTTNPKIWAGVLEEIALYLGILAIKTHFFHTYYLKCITKNDF